MQPWIAGSIYYFSMKTRFCHFSNIFSMEVRNECVFFLMQKKTCDEETEQRIQLKLFVKLKKILTQCYQLLKEAFGENYLSHACVSKWYKRFSEG